MRFLVGLDGSAAAAAGLDVLESLRLGPDDEVLVLAAVERPLGLALLGGPPEASAWFAEIREGAVEHCRRIASDAATRLSTRTRTTPLVVDGHPLDVIERVAVEREVDVVVVGPHGRGRLEELLAGSVSQGLLHWLRVPVLVARPARAPIRSIVLAVDGSPHALAAAQRLAALPLEPGATVECLTVLPLHEGEYGRAWSDGLYPVVRAAEEASAARALEDAAGVLAASGLPVTCSVRRGNPKRWILDAAREREADLIVMGARGLGGFASLVIGSVSRAVSKAAPCSVLVVHERIQGVAASAAPTG